MEIDFKGSFERDIRNIHDRKLLQKLKNIIEAVGQAKNVSEIAGIKKIRTDEAYYRIRTGDYRIGIKVENNIIIFVRFLHRKEIYRYFP
ncbi:MAG: plasmid stabilization system [bacterium]|nr:MAG: plasmid stabilization system [bacterium]